MQESIMAMEGWRVSYERAFIPTKSNRSSKPQQLNKGAIFAHIEAFLRRCRWASSCVVWLFNPLILRYRARCLSSIGCVYMVMFNILFHDPSVPLKLIAGVETCWMFVPPWNNLVKLEEARIWLATLQVQNYGRWHPCGYGHVQKPSLWSFQCLRPSLKRVRPYEDLVRHIVPCLLVSPVQKPSTLLLHGSSSWVWMRQDASWPSSLYSS